MLKPIRPLRIHIAIPKPQGLEIQTLLIETRVIIARDK
jgi:hypothetical protein